jgi:hypothetical protein
MERVRVYRGGFEDESLCEVDESEEIMSERTREGVTQKA